MGETAYPGPDFLNIRLRDQLDKAAQEDFDFLEQIDRTTPARALDSIDQLLKLLMGRSKALNKLLRVQSLEQIDSRRENRTFTMFSFYTDPYVYEFDTHLKVLNRVTEALHHSLQVPIGAVGQDIFGALSTEILRKLPVVRRSLLRYVEYLHQDGNKLDPFYSASLKVTEFDEAEKHFIDFFDRENSRAKARVSAMGLYGVRAKYVSISASIKTRISQIEYLADLSKTLDTLRASGMPIARFDVFSPLQMFWLIEILAHRPELLGPLQSDRSKQFEEPLNSLCNLWQRYLVAFSISATDNIMDDSKIIVEPNYLKSPFPRALTGQFVFDCGVYAVMTLFVLSAAAKRLGLKLRFIRMPFHVGVVVTRQEPGTEDTPPASGVAPSLPEHLLVVAHNESVFVMAREHDKTPWMSTAAACKHSQAGGLEYYLGEYAIAAYYTASYVDAPFDLLPVNTLTKPIDDVWVKFRELSTNVPLFRPNISPSSLSDFPNRFLRLSEAQKRRHNSEIFKFWNQTARQLWEALTRRPSPENPSPPIAESAYKYLLRDAYGTSVLESFEALEQRADNEIGVPLHQHAGSSGKLLTPNSMVSCIDRLNGRRIIFGWSKQLEDYMTGSLKQSGKVLLADEPPFTQWLDPID